jgi:PAS domain S-box-containing protein
MDIEPIRSASAATVTSKGMNSLLAWCSGFLIFTVVCALMFIFINGNYGKQIAELSRTQTLARELQTLWIDAETGQRGFLLTGSESYLEPYDRAKLTYLGTFDALRRSLVADPALSKAMDVISDLQTLKSAELDQTLSLYRAGRLPDALTIVAAGSGKATMDRLRDEFAKLDRDIVDRTSGLDFQQRAWIGLLLASFTAALLAGLFAAAWQLLKVKRSLSVTLLERDSILVSNATLKDEVAAGAAGLSNATNLLRAITDSVRDALYAKDLNGLMIFANPACLRIMGKTEAEVIGASITELTPRSDEAAKIADADKAVLLSGEIVTAEEEYTIDGNTALFLSTKAPLRDAHGQTHGLVGISIDITERKLAEKNLHQSEQRFKAAVKAIHGVLWTNTPAGEMAGEQEAWGALTGQTPEEYSGYGWAKAVHEDDAQPTIDEWQEAVEEKRPFRFEHRVMRHDGEWRLFSIHAIPVLDSDGIILEWVGVHLDITDERELQLQLARTAEQLSLALDAGHIGTWEIDLLTGANVWDDRLFGLWGMTGPIAPPLESVFKIIDPRDRERVASQIDQLQEPGGSGIFDVEFRIIRANDGKERWLAARGRTIGGSFSGRTVLGTTRDITERKKRDEQIRFLMGELSHRTKNILAVILAIARQTTRDAISLETFSQSFTQRITAIAGSLDLLNEENWSSASILELIRVQTSAVAGENGERIKLSGDDVALLPDAAQNLGLALHELSINATKYGALSVPGGRIALDWRIAKGVEGEKIFSLVWKERGGPPVLKPTRKGFGHTVMNRLVNAALSGNSLLEFEPDGVKWSLNIPISRILQTSPSA